MIERYFPFNAEQFLKDYTKIEKEKEDLTQKLAEITELGGQDYAKVGRSGNIHDLSIGVIRKEAIEVRLKALDEYFKLYSNIMDRLDTSEKRFVKQAFLENKTAKDLHISNSNFNTTKSLILAKIRELMRWV